MELKGSADSGGFFVRLQMLRMKRFSTNFSISENFARSYNLEISCLRLYLYVLSAARSNMHINSTGSEGPVYGSDTVRVQ